ncbi:nuclear/nucleolar GTPase 2-like [Salvia divinorum]|uniref:Squalene monooxygenase n=1 Tax=Salvia divinorum TaxID=28513 RepID=A0ABD1IHR9_SALDI
MLLQFEKESCIPQHRGSVPSRHPGAKLSSISNGDMAKYLKATMASQLPHELHDAFLEHVEKGEIRYMPNRTMPASPLPTPGAILLGDAFNMRHPLTGGGMTVALANMVVLRDLLRPMKDFSDVATLTEHLEAFYTLSKKELEHFRDELQTCLLSSNDILLKGRKLPMSLLNDHQKQARVHLLDTQPFTDTFGLKTKRKKPKLLASDYESIVWRAEILDAFGEKHCASTSTEGDGDGFRDLVRHTMFEKGQSKRIWGELYKVIDSSDVVVQVFSSATELLFWLAQRSISIE